ncbi:DUF4190 domain-containing protein [Kibdelosporangium phytohabitans]|uniref:DUF4190 domain-containing protein n=1 Tax=Kibdelosporangium phytohabitans TaxID=860235 RepID=UPI0015D01774|nr:DUF4190 domain-containing protein [Kibdelosporangium phytohabitans]MBE1463655.1 UPF0716 family protein affecting phage T7 exclusion [Kibdelosporangium phytohabitans]
MAHAGTSRRRILVTYPPHQQQAGPHGVAQPQNGLGVAGFVLGIVGLVFSFIPIIGVIAWPLVIIGVVLSGVGISKAKKGEANNLGLAVAGLVTSVVGLVLCIAWVSALS